MSAYFLEVMPGSTITADAQGFPNEEAGCYGGANAGNGGGHEVSPALYHVVNIIFTFPYYFLSQFNRDGDNYNPEVYGQTGGICAEKYTNGTLPSTSEALGGGVVRIIAAFAKLNANITANGASGGAGG